MAPLRRRSPLRGLLREDYLYEVFSNSQDKINPRFSQPECVIGAIGREIEDDAVPSRNNRHELRQCSDSIAEMDSDIKSKKVLLFLFVPPKPPHDDSVSCFLCILRIDALESIGLVTPTGPSVV